MLPGFSTSYRGIDGITCIVAMPRSPYPFTACGRHHGMLESWLVTPPELVTCLRCWAREFLELLIQESLKV